MIVGGEMKYVYDGHIGDASFAGCCENCGLEFGNAQKTETWIACPKCASRDIQIYYHCHAWWMTDDETGMRDIALEVRSTGREKQEASDSIWDEISEYESSIENDWVEGEEGQNFLDNGMQVAREDEAFLELIRQLKSHLTEEEADALQDALDERKDLAQLFNTHWISPSDLNQLSEAVERDYRNKNVKYLRYVSGLEKLRALRSLKTKVEQEITSLDQTLLISAEELKLQKGASAELSDGQKVTMRIRRRALFDEAAVKHFLGDAYYEVASFDKPKVTQKKKEILDSIQDENLRNEILKTTLSGIEKYARLHGLSAKLTSELASLAEIRQKPYHHWQRGKD